MTKLGPRKLHICPKVNKMKPANGRRFSSLIAAEGRFARGTSATQRQKFHTDDVNQCLHNKSGSHGLPNANLFNFGMGRTWEKFSSLPAKKRQKFETATVKENF